MRLKSVLGHSAAAASQNSDRLLTWGSHFAERRSRVWSYDMELLPPAANSPSAIPSSGAQQPSKSGDGIGVQPACKDISAASEGRSLPDDASPAGPRLPTKKRRRTTALGDAGEEPSGKSDLIQDGDCGSEVESSDSCHSNGGDGASCSGANSCSNGSLSGGSSNESGGNGEESSVSSAQPEPDAAAQNKRERERIRDCQREMQLKQQSLDTTMLTSPALAAGVSFPALPPGPSLGSSESDATKVLQNPAPSDAKDLSPEGAAFRGQSCWPSAKTSATGGQPEDKPSSTSGLPSS